MFSRLLRLAGLLLLAGCAAAPVAQGPRPVNSAYSPALNLAIAAGEVEEPAKPFLIDRPASEVAPLLPATPSSGEHPAVTLGYAVANAVNPPPGIRPGLGLGFSVLSLLVSGPTYTPGQQDQVYVWAPVELGATSNQALGVAIDRVLQAYATTVGTGYRLVCSDKPCQLDKAWLDGPGCSSQNCLFRGNHTPGSSRQIIDSPAAIHHPGKVYRPWRLQVLIPTHPPGQQPSPPALATPSLDQLKVFSQALPEWMAVYLAPKAGGNAVPLVLSRGETLAFIQPGT